MAALTCMLPHAILISPYPRDALFEATAVFIVGNLVAFTFNALRRERKHHLQLAAHNKTSSVISQSLRLSEILDNSINEIQDLMNVDAVLVFLKDEETGELTLMGYRGITGELAQSMGRIKLNGNSMGRVAQTGEPLFLEDASHDSGLGEMVAEVKYASSMLIVPLKSEGRVTGTLCVISHSQRHFNSYDVDLLSGIGNQISVAVDKAFLYEQAWQVSEQLAISEERYRELFENANDAIWVHDLQGNIIAANESMFELTGYTLTELRCLKANDIIAEGCAEKERIIQDPLIKGNAMKLLSELTLRKKDGSEAWVQFSTSPVLSNGHINAFQHIARDVTEEKRMKENLRFYLRQVTKAQEDERKRIARELHDEVIQSLASLSLELDGFASSDKDLPRDKKITLENLQQKTISLTEDVRRLSQSLRPATLDRLGLLPALESLASDIAKRSEIALQVNAHGAGQRLPSEVELTLFRIAQEAIRNVWWHSQATNAEIVAEFNESKARITISDNGQGFNVPSTTDDLVKEGRLGLAGMYERAHLLGGSLQIHSTPTNGTKVTIEVPM
jgi:PAS domain S-box-containing protein